MFMVNGSLGPHIRLTVAVNAVAVSAVTLVLLLQCWKIVSGITLLCFLG